MRLTHVGKQRYSAHNDFRGLWVAAVIIGGLGAWIVGNAMEWLPGKVDPGLGPAAFGLAMVLGAAGLATWRRGVTVDLGDRTVQRWNSVFGLVFARSALLRRYDHIECSHKLVRSRSGAVTLFLAELVSGSRGQRFEVARSTDLEEIEAVVADLQELTGIERR